MELERDKLAVIDEKTEIAIEVCVPTFIVKYLPLVYILSGAFRCV